MRPELQVIKDFAVNFQIWLHDHMYACVHAIYISTYITKTILVGTLKIIYSSIHARKPHDVIMKNDQNHEEIQDLTS